MAEKEMPTGVKVISILYFIGAGILILLGLLMAIGAGFVAPLMTKVIPNMASAGTVIGIVMVVIGVFCIGMGVFDIFIGRGLWKGQSWARIVTIVLSIMGVCWAVLGLFGAIITVDIASIIFQLIVGGIQGFIAYYLLTSAEVKAAFA